MKLKKIEARCERARLAPAVGMPSFEFIALHQDLVRNTLPEAIRRLREAREIFITARTSSIGVKTEIVDKWLSEVEE